MSRLLPAVLTAAIFATVGLVNPAAADGCKLGSLLQQVASALGEVVQMDNGGIFSPSRMWAALVDRDGVLCGVVKTGDAWPGSRAIAIAKAGTANDFSNSALSLSTAMLYAPTQPGGSLYGLNNSNPFNPFFNEVTTKSGPRTGVGDTPGGIITFGGGQSGTLFQRPGDRRPWS
jgi:hypothetical protein